MNTWINARKKELMKAWKINETMNDMNGMKWNENNMRRQKSKWNVMKLMNDMKLHKMKITWNEIKWTKKEINEWMNDWMNEKRHE